MARSRSITIRMGAAHHDVTVHDKGGDTHFDLRAMDRLARGKFHGVFMGEIRRAFRARAVQPGGAA